MMRQILVRRTQWLNLVLVLVAIPPFLTGCVTPGGTISGPTTPVAMPSWLGGGTSGTRSETSERSDLTPAEKRMREQSKAFQRTVWEGALIGASAGALWGIIKGDKGSDVAKKAIIGGAVGGLAGAYVGHKQKQYSDKEDQLNSMIADVRQSNNDSKELITSVRQVIAEDKRRLASVEKRYKSGKATETELKETRARIADNKAVVAQASKDAREQHTVFEDAERSYRQQNPGTDTGPLKNELKAYDRQIETLDGLADSIAVA